MSLRATVPGLNLCGLLTPPGTVGDFPLEVDLAAATFFLGCLEPVAFLAVCLVLAILKSFLLIIKIDYTYGI